MKSKKKKHKKLLRFYCVLLPSMQFPWNVLIWLITDHNLIKNSVTLNGPYTKERSTANSWGSLKHELAGTSVALKFWPCSVTFLVTVNSAPCIGLSGRHNSETPEQVSLRYNTIIRTSWLTLCLWFSVFYWYVNGLFRYLSRELRPLTHFVNKIRLLNRLCMGSTRNIR